MPLARGWALAPERVPEPEEMGALLLSAGSSFEDESIERRIGAPVGNGPAIDAGGLGCFGKGRSFVGDLPEDDAVAPRVSGECGVEVVHGRSVGRRGWKVHGVLAWEAKCMLPPLPRVG